MSSPNQTAGRSDPAKSGGLGSGAWFLAVMFLGYFAFTADRTVLSSVLKPLSAALQASKATYYGVAATASSVRVTGIITTHTLSYPSAHTKYSQFTPKARAY